MDQSKTCTTCKEAKSLEDFYVRRASKDGRSYVCQKCDRTRAKAAARANPEKKRAYYHANRDRILAYRKEYHENRPEETRARKRREHLRGLYGLSEDDYDRMRAAQGGLCAICQEPESAIPRGVLFIDHCHTTGHVRGLLCHHCNAGLGSFRDDPSRLAGAISYIRGEPV